MKNNFETKFKLFDVFVIIFAVIAIAISIIYADVKITKGSTSNKVVEIYYQGELLENKIVNFDDIEEEVEIVLTKEEYPDLLGDMHILVNKEKGICVSEVTCPNHTCEKTGWISFPNFPITCIPNGVFVVINTPSVDSDIIL